MSKMHSIAGWKIAQRPNYKTNIDKSFPYSEVPFLGEYHLVKIPVTDLINHVDYWGEGKISTQHGISGFSNCYNVNHTYQLVSNGPDRGRKIPNRIPVVNYTNCNTSGYIKDNSVRTVTVMGAPINTSCAKDIARMVNIDLGQVVAYGFETNSQEIKNLQTELKNKGIFHCPGYTLPEELQGLTLFDSHMAFLNLSALKDELYNNVANGSYDNAVNLSKNLDNESGRGAIRDIVTKLISTRTNNIMAYAYKLWNSGGKDIVRNNFPVSFSLILNEGEVTIVNKQYKQALKLDTNKDSFNDRLAWGDKSDKTGKRVSWKFIPIWDNNSVSFKLYNIEYGMYLKLDANVDSDGNRKAWGSTNYNEVRHRYYLEPMMSDETLVFSIINCQYNQRLKLDANIDSYGDRLLWGHNGGNANSSYEHLEWIIAAW